MTTSEKGIELIKGFEGCVLHAYQDAVGVWTIGYGITSADIDITGTSIRSGMEISQETAEDWLRESLRRKYEPLVSMYQSYGWNQNEFDALVSFCFNIGSIGGLTAKGTRTRAEIAEKWTDYCHAGGKVLSGLVARRKKERDLFLTPMSRGGLFESDITLCGHGSGKPSLKNMEKYLSDRYAQLAPNGLHKGVVAVRRCKGISPDKFREVYQTMLGRNVYSQNLREYALTPWMDGKYYSDCSSSGDAALQKAGAPGIGWLNTAGIYRSGEFEDVPVVISEGHILNPEILQVGDALLFVGNDPSRPKQIGHVEFVYDISTPQDYPYWIHSDGKWYYRVGDGQNAHGWREINNHWYYFDEKGAALKGLHTVHSDAFGDEVYYFCESGDLECALCRTDSRGALAPWDLQ